MPTASRAGRPKNSDPEAARRALLAAGEHLFAAQSFDRVTMSAIAAEAGLSKAMVRYYFGDKESLYGAVVDHVVSSVLADLEARLPGAADPVDGLSDYLALLCEAIVSRPSFPRMILRDYLDGELMNRPETAKSLRRFMETTQARYEEGRAAGLFVELDPHILHLSLVGAAAFFAVTIPFRARASEKSGLPDMDLRSRAFVEQLRATLLEGVKRRDA